jgi:hypothetical protein
MPRLAILLALILPTAACADDAADLRAALTKTASTSSQGFTVTDGPGKPLVGVWQKDKPLSVTADGIPFFKKGDKLVYKDAGKWQRTRTGTLSDPLRILGPSARVRTLVPPQEELTRLAKVAKAVKKDRDGYTVTLSDEASRAWVPPSERGVARGGTVSVTVAGGMVTKYVVKVRLKGRRGGAEVDGEATRTVELRNAGKAKVDVPKEAAKLLE